MDIDLLKKLRDTKPFLTILEHNNVEYVGIVHNTDNKFISFYDYGSIPADTEDSKLRKHFLYLGDKWWWESNNSLPIDIFLSHNMTIYSRYIKTFSLKETVIISGPEPVSLGALVSKRLKKRQITLLKKV